MKETPFEEEEVEDQSVGVFFCAYLVLLSTWYLMIEVEWVEEVHLLSHN